MDFLWQRFAEARIFTDKAHGVQRLCYTDVKVVMALFGTQWSRSFCGMLDLLYLPPALRRRGAFCLHVSDTPSVFFTSLRRLIALLEPSLVIHTGDLVDDVKLGLYPSLLPDYRRGVRELARVLRHCPGRVVVTLGNHDDFKVAREALPFCDVYEASAAVTFEALRFRIAHEASQLVVAPGDMALFGHDGTPSQRRDGVMWLNGQLTLNLIDWRSGDVHELAYPRFVDEARQNLKRCKL